MIETARGAEPRQTAWLMTAAATGVEDGDNAVGEAATRRRARPMAPEDRRREILQAVIPLLRQRGLNISTREIAQAAGVAEGTVFRVFADKKALFAAAMDVVLDPAELETRIAAIDGETLGDVVWAIVQILVERTQDVGQVMGLLRGADPMVGPRSHPRPTMSVQQQLHADRDHPRQMQARMTAVGTRVRDAIGRRIKPFEADLGLDAEVVASVIMSSSFIISHPMRIAQLNAATLTTVLLNGVRSRPDPWTPH